MRARVPPLWCCEGVRFSIVTTANNNITARGQSAQLVASLQTRQQAIHSSADIQVHFPLAAAHHLDACAPLPRPGITGYWNIEAWHPCHDHCNSLEMR